ncbi:MAG: hypothetical protein J6S19_03910 [Lentisphaeria bacterium]|nr:hypothetical protein [Lentisphaeria bacterium]
MKFIWTIVLCIFLTVLSASDMVMIISDSTAVDYRGKKNPYNKNKVGWEPMSGWGEFAAIAGAKDVKIINRSVGGYSSKTYWKNLHKRTSRDFRKGGWLLLSFGSNDARHHPKTAYRCTTTDGTFPEYMNKIASDAKAVGMNVVIISPPPFYSTENGKFFNSILKPYAEASKKLAAENGYFFIDLFGAVNEYFANMSNQDILSHYMFLKPGDSPNWPNGRKDPLHFTGKGSKMIWEIIRNAIKKDIPELSKLFN